MKRRDPSLSVKEKEINHAAETWILQHADERVTNVVATIPVVVHVLYKTAAENISDNQVQSQIDVLNEDFAKLNTDTTLIPAVWKSVAGDTQLQFCLASKKSDGTATTGIERRSTTNSEWDNYDDMKSDATGGLDAWDRNSYMNIWVGNLGGGVLGVTQLPGGPASTDGMCILYSAFGRTGVLIPTYDKGRTATHETGHWLGLRHIWGDDGTACTGSDNINDTPNQAGETFGCPTFPTTDACSPTPPGIMFMNYMDYTDDACMCMFTNDQATAMNSILNTNRHQILFSNSCNGRISNPGVEESIEVHANTFSQTIDVFCHFYSEKNLTVTITDLLGRVLTDETKLSVLDDSFEFKTELFAFGIYFVKAEAGGISVVQKVIVKK